MSHASTDAYRLTLEDEPSQEDLEVVQAGLNAYNESRPAVGNLQRLAVLVRNADGREGYPGRVHKLFLRKILY